MIACVPTHYSRAIARIGDALQEHSGVVAVKRIPPMAKDSRRTHRVPGEDAGDVVVIFANGLRDHQQALAERCLERGQKYAVVQIALRTTRHPNTNQWRTLWSKAAVVWSYYPLDLWIEEDKGPKIDFPFLHAPLGVNGNVFFDRSVSRTYTVCTSGQRRGQEGVGECDDAVRKLGTGSIFQLGPTFPMNSPTTFLTELSDNALADMYSRCRWVSGLRRHEGFELPAAEGLLCGARPVLYDRPHYRQWFGTWAAYVPEESPSRVAERLTELFRAGPKPVSAEEKKVAAALFSWSSIVHRFWKAVKNG